MTTINETPYLVRIDGGGGSSDYSELSNKPQIEGNTLEGNKTAAELGLQNKLTAGENITIENGVISATGGSGPEAYIKSASVSDNTLTLINQDDESTDFTPENTEYTAGAGISISEDNVISATGGGGDGGIQQYAVIADRPDATHANLGEICFIEKGDRYTFQKEAFNRFWKCLPNSSNWEYVGTPSGSFTVAVDLAVYLTFVTNEQIDPEAEHVFKWSSTNMGWQCDDGATYYINNSLGFTVTGSPSNGATYTLSASVKSGKSGYSWKSIEVSGLPLGYSTNSNIYQDGANVGESSVNSFAANRASSIGSTSFAANDSTASGTSSFAVNHGKATGADSFASGTGEATAMYAHAEGYNTKATQYYAHAEGTNTQATGYGSHAEGNNVVVSKNYAHAQGRHNIRDVAGVYAHIVGNGLSATQLSNAHTLDWDGNAWFKGAIRIGGNEWSEGTALLTGDDIVDELDSTATDKALSANMGNELKSNIDGKQDKLTAGDGIIINENGTITTNDEYSATVEYVDATITDVMLYIDQQDRSEHAGRVAGDDLINAKIGDLSTLETTEKTSLVGAINELSDKLGDIEAILAAI